MSLNSILEKVLKEDALLKKRNDDLILRERQANMIVQVVGAPVLVTAIRLNKFSHFSVLKNDNSRTTKCDYLLIVELDGTIHAIFIEMKKTFTQENEPREQLRRSRPFLAYLLSVCEIENEFILDPKPIEKYVIIAEKFSERFDKQRVKPNNIPTEHYKGIEIRNIVKTTVSLADLTNS